MTKRMTFRCVGMLLMVFVIAGCSNAGSNHNSHGGAPTGSLIEVAITTQPQSVQAGQEVVLQAEITQDGDKVDDADEVMFEVRRSGSDDSAMLLGEHAGEGLYTVTHTFADAATYFVTAHATARGMHNMPTLELDVSE